MCESHVGSEMCIRDREETAAFLQFLSDGTEAGEIKLQYNIFYQIAIFCGLRRGESIALLWSDIDFEAKTMSITKSTSIVKGKAVTKSTKTKSSAFQTISWNYSGSTVQNMTATVILSAPYGLETIIFSFSGTERRCTHLHPLPHLRNLSTVTMRHMRISCRTSVCMISGILPPRY